MTPENIKVGYYSLALSVIGGHDPEVAINVINGDKKAKKWTPGAAETMLDMRASGYTYEQIANFFNTNKATIWTIINRYNKKAL